MASFPLREGDAPIKRPHFGQGVRLALF